MMKRMRTWKINVVVVLLVVFGIVAVSRAETPVGQVPEGYQSLWFASATGLFHIETDFQGNVYAAVAEQGVWKYLPDLNGDTYSNGRTQIISHNIYPDFIRLSQDGQYLFTGHEATGRTLVEYDLQTDTWRDITPHADPNHIITRMVGTTREIYTAGYASNAIYKMLDLDPSDDHTDASTLLVDPPGNTTASWGMAWGPGVTAAGDYGTDLYYGSATAIYRTDVEEAVPTADLFSEFDGHFLDFDRWGQFGGYLYGLSYNGKSIYQILPDGSWGDPFATYTDNVHDLAFAEDGSALYVTVGDNIIVITPEPGTLGLLIVGGLALLRRRRK